VPTLQFLAIFLVVVAAVYFVRRVFIARNLAFLVAFAQVIAIPGAGVVFYVFEPTDVPDSTWFAIAGVGMAFIALGIRIVTGGRAERRPPDHVWTSDELGRGSRMALVIRALEGGGFTTLVFGLEPAFALANLVVNAAWVALCLPYRLRESTAENSIDIDASPAAVWRVMTDPSLGVWKTDRVIQMESVPAGSLRLGTKILSVSRTTLTRPWRGLNEILVRSESEVIEFVEGSSFTARSSDGSAWTRRDVAANGAGSTVRMASRFRSTIPGAILGRALEIRSGMRGYTEIAQQMLAKLKTEVASGS
jgi:hypothetical protein